MTSFAHTLDVIESLPVDEQEGVLEILQRRLAEHRRAELLATVKESRKEFAAGKYKAASIVAIMRALLSPGTA